MRNCDHFLWWTEVIRTLHCCCQNTSTCDQRDENHLHNSKPFPTSTRSRSNDNFLQNQSLKCLNIQQNIFWNNQIFKGLRNNLYCICVYCVFCPVKWNQISYSFEFYPINGFSFVIQFFLFCSFVLLSCNKFDVVNQNAFKYNELLESEL